MPFRRIDQPATVVDLVGVVSDLIASIAALETVHPSMLGGAAVSVVLVTPAVSSSPALRAARVDVSQVLQQD